MPGLFRAVLQQHPLIAAGSASDRYSTWVAVPAWWLWQSQIFRWGR